jgi:hypothetical protein
MAKPQSATISKVNLIVKSAPSFVDKQILANHPQHDRVRLVNEFTEEKSSKTKKMFVKKNDVKCYDVTNTVMANRTQDAYHQIRTTKATDKALIFDSRQASSEVEM